MGERLGRFITRYRETYFLPDKRKRYGHILLQAAAERGKMYIRENIGHMHLNESGDHLNMPKRMDNVVTVEMTKRSTSCMTSCRRRCFSHLTRVILTRSTPPLCRTRLLQTANGALYDENGNVRYIHDRKLDALEDLIEAAVGKPILVFYNFKHDKDRIRRAV